MTPWTREGFPVDQLPDDCVGFVYVITNRLNGKKYIGKKLARHRKTQYRTETLKSGLKRKRAVRSLVDSDWPTYWGSCQELIRDVATLGHTNFSREILHYCTSKAETTYMETLEQFRRGVLLSDQYYNGQIHCHISKRHLKDLDKTK
jgi:hypothetical protein